MSPSEHRIRTAAIAISTFQAMRNIFRSSSWFRPRLSPECCGVAVVLRCGTRSPDSGNSSLSEARLMPYCCRAVPPSPPLQIPCDGPAFGGRAGRVVSDHAGGFPVPGQHDFGGGRAARRQFGREPDPATVRRHARLDAGGAGGRGEAALNLQRRQPDHPIRGCGSLSRRRSSDTARRRRPPLDSFSRSAR